MPSIPFGKATPRRRPYLHPKLNCYLNSISYSFSTRTGELHFPPANCWDMEDAVEVFMAIDLEVQLIHTFVDDKPYTSYARSSQSSTDWTALPR